MLVSLPVASFVSSFYGVRSRRLIPARNFFASGKVEVRSFSAHSGRKQPEPAEILFLFLSTAAAERSVQDPFSFDPGSFTARIK
jgi:hypothetical protein